MIHIKNKLAGYCLLLAFLSTTIVSCTKNGVSEEPFTRLP